jgi:predicted ATP-dependent endonuclease of OLD family
MITRVIIKNYKRFSTFDVTLNDDLNIIVGDNESGKSTLLECINLALCFKLNGRSPQNEITPYIFSKDVVTEYITQIQTNPNAPLPEILIELYFTDSDEVAHLRGSMNSQRLDSNGIKVLIRFNESFREAYNDFVTRNASQMTSVPIEYYEVVRFSFADEAQQIDFRSMPVVSSILDATNIRLQSGTDTYIRNVVNEVLDNNQKAELSLAFRSLKESFFENDAIQAINTALGVRKGDITEKELGVSIDVSQKSGWDSHLMPYLDNIPFHFSGMGEQSSLKLLLTLNKEIEGSQIILIEEIENHLSFSTMAKLLKRIKDKCEGKQIIITTHDTYVLNKLGIDNLILIGKNNTTTSLSSLSEDTQDYFEKLPGYDTLRMVLAKKSILVEGPSDELIVQRAYVDQYGKLPIEDGVDVICVRGLSFKRFLDIASILKTNTSVVTDNDGSFATKITTKYAPYADKDNIRIYASDNNALKTLEPQIIAVNQLAVLNSILGTNFQTTEEATSYMTDSDNKTDVALKIFKSETRITYPDYVINAITREE